MIDQGLRHNKKDPKTGRPFLNPRYAYLAPLYGQVKKVAWDYLKDFTKNIPGAVSNEADLRVDIPRPHLGDKISFTLLGADNPDSLRGIYLDGVVLDEYGDMNPEMWRKVIRPALSDRTGWAIFIGTPKGRNSFWDLYNKATNGFPLEEGGVYVDPEWYGALYTVEDTKIISDDELESASREMTDDEYAQEFLCSFQAGITGAYFAKEIAEGERQGKFTSVPYDPVLPVDTYWDLGINDVTSVWFVQTHGHEHRFIDYFEEPDLNIPQLINKIRDKKYLLGETVLPHDAQVRDLSTGKTRVEVFRSLGMRPRIVKRIEDKLDSIHAARMILPKCVFDREKCKRGIEALMNYQRKWDPKSQVFSTKPMHNWASNGADAFQQFAMGKEDRKRIDDSQRQTHAESAWDPYK